MSMCVYTHTQNLQMAGLQQQMLLQQQQAALQQQQAAAQQRMLPGGLLPGVP
jgi:hypothetical protein